LECLSAGYDWLYLRVCLSCGFVGCCDSSRGKHARKHAYDAHHPIIESLEPGENWRYCYFDDEYIRDGPSSLVGAGLSTHQFVQDAMKRAAGRFYRQLD
jgi:uncharacterized UBP type Zn finger protein